MIEFYKELLMAPSSSGLGRRPFKAQTRIRIPLGPFFINLDSVRYNREIVMYLKHNPFRGCIV